ncbi:hypothetical protein AAEX63_10505 [Luteococcus sp. H138]|uniref:hypothetical protein n=1 Tax=unclassified Luteococcus TaxID=2639923 RepID=UPI00313C97CA
MSERRTQWYVRATFLTVWCYWLILWRVPVWSQDDLHFANRSRLPLGGLVWQRLPVQAWQDLDHRNGRLADMGVQLVMSLRDWIGPTVSLVCLAQVLALYFLLRPLSDVLQQRVANPWPRVVVAVLATLLPFATFAQDPTIAGSTVMFLSACVGYVGGSALLFVCLRQLWETSRRPSPRLAGVTVLLCWWACLHHELLALALVGACVALLLVSKRSATLWATAIPVCLVGLGRFAARGLWARRAYRRSPFPQDGYPGWQQSLGNAVHSSTQLVVHHPLILGCGLVGVLALLVAASRTEGLATRRFAVALAADGAVLTLLAHRVNSRAWRDGLFQPRMQTYQSISAAAVLLALAVLVALLVLAAWQLRSVPGGAVVGMLLGAALGAVAMPTAMGAPGGRMMYFGLTLVLVVAAASSLAAVALTWGCGVETSALATAALVVICGSGVQSATSLAPAVERNIQAWRPTLVEIQRVKEGKASRVHVLRDLPYPQYSENYIVLHPKTLQPRLMFYYGLDEATPVIVR